MTVTSDSSPRSVAAKVLAILNAFGPHAPELSLNALSRASGLPTSTTYRLARELVELGALEHGSNHVGYRIGLQLWETGSLAQRGLTLRDVSIPFMQDLYEVTHDNVHLAVLDGYNVLYLEKVAGRESMSIESQEARRLPLHATGVGKVLLADSSEAFLQEVIERGLPRFTPHTIVTPGGLRAALERIRQSGVSFGHEELTMGTVSIAAPIRDAEGAVVAALSIVGRTRYGGDLQRLGLAIRTAALGITRSNRERGIREHYRPAGSGALSEPASAALNTPP